MPAACAKHDCAPTPQEFALSDEMVHTCSTLCAAKKGVKYGPRALEDSKGRREAGLSQEQNRPVARAGVQRRADHVDVPVVHLARPLPELGLRQKSLWRFASPAKAAQHQPV